MAKMIEPNHVYNMNCLQGMQQMEPRSVDFVLTDLPYGTTACRWDVQIDLTEFWSGIGRIAKPSAVIALYAQNPFAAKLICSNIHKYKYEWIWSKHRPTGFLSCNKAPLRGHESILIFRAGQHKTVYHPQLIKSAMHVISNGTRHNNIYHTHDYNVPDKYTDFKYPVDVLEFGKNNLLGHSTSKPVALNRYLIRTYTDPGMIVLDCCMGSGSTAIAAIAEQRNYIGFELDPDIYTRCVDNIAHWEKFT
jgi:site-specific DNA-methyltransferase (adenine-specific)